MFERLQQYVQVHPRRSAVIGGVGLLLIVFCLILINRATTGVIIIKSAAENTIVLNKEGESSSIQGQQGNLKARLSPGRYIATVGNRSASTKRFVEVTARKTTSYTINLAKQLDLQSVLPLGASNLVAGTDIMYYVDISDHLLYRLDGSGQPTPVDQAVSFESIKWQSEHYGVGVTSDEAGLYSVNDGVLSPITLPFQAKRVYYDLSTGGRLVVSDGKTVYAAQPGGAFVKIYTVGSSDSIVSLFASDGDVLLRLDKVKGSTGDEGASIVIDAKGTKIAANPDLSAYNYRWSPDGKKLAVTTDSSTLIYDNRLRQLREIADGNVTGLSWLDDNTVLYGLGTQLFSYAIDSSDSAQLAVVPIDSGVIGVYPSVGGSEIYVLSAQDKNQDQRTLSRAALTTKGQNVPLYYQTLFIFFPSSTEQCHFSYSNFRQPTILITSWTDPDTCTDAAREELKADKLPISQFNIVLAASSVDE